MREGQEARYEAALQRLTTDDVVAALRAQRGPMARLGREGAALKLDWVEGVARLLADPTALERVEGEARALHARGIRQIVWAGMGGSILTVRVLHSLGLFTTLPIYPLDSTDPAALNALLREIAQTKGLPVDGAPDVLRVLLQDVLLVGVAMGMTSEEPIGHLEWFAALLKIASLSPTDHLLVMALPDSLLDRAARRHGVPTLPLQLDGGNGTPGRMSAPSTRVFLLPAALALLPQGQGGDLRRVLQAAWSHHDLEGATAAPQLHPFVQLAAALSAAAENGCCRLLLDLPPRWRPLRGWIEQLLEESLGKGQRGVAVFDDQPLWPSPCRQAAGVLRVQVVDKAVAPEGDGAWVVTQSDLAADDSVGLLTAAAVSFLGWQLTTALYGYLHDITFAGQPAVEDYKARARSLRAQSQPLTAAFSNGRWVTHGALTLFTPPHTPIDGTPATVFAAALRAACTQELHYLDLTYNGRVPLAWATLLEGPLQRLANERLGIPLKVREAPAAYHASEQGEMDGLPGVVSLRLLSRTHEPALVGDYDDRFLTAQAVATWQAMCEVGRSCFLLVVEGPEEEATVALRQFCAALDAAPFTP